MDQIVTVIIVIISALGLGIFFKSRGSSGEMNQLDEELILKKAKIKELKKQGKELKQANKKTGKEFEDALADYNNKYRPNHDIDSSG